MSFLPWEGLLLAPFPCLVSLGFPGWCCSDAVPVLLRTAITAPQAKPLPTGSRVERSRHAAPGGRWPQPALTVFVVLVIVRAEIVIRGIRPLTLPRETFALWQVTKALTISRPSILVYITVC
jgi:hypothetical protein